MQVVIDIQDDVYKRALVYKDVQLVSNRANDLSELITAVANGTVLPKGHGRLIDADAYKKEMLNSREFDFFKRLDMQPTIIEADEETEGEDEPCNRCKHSNIEDAQSGYCDSCYSGEYFKPEGDKNADSN